MGNNKKINGKRAKKVLVAGYDLETCESIVEYLHDHYSPIETYIAKQSKETMEKARLLNPDLIVIQCCVNYYTRLGDSPHLVELLRKEMKKTPIYVFAITAHENLEERARNAGANGTLKSTDISKINELYKNYLE